MRHGQCQTRPFDSARAQESRSETHASFSFTTTYGITDGTGRRARYALTENAPELLTGSSVASVRLFSPACVVPVRRQALLRASD